MMEKLLKAAPVVDHYLESLKHRTNILLDINIRPLLKIILVGQNPASQLYTQNKKKFSEKIGAQCDIVSWDENISPEKFVHEVEKIVLNPHVHGCLIQLPLPPQLGHLDISRLIPPEKDVDGFHYLNLYQIMNGEKGDRGLIPCTPKGIVTLLHFYGIPLKGKHVVIIGRSLIVGKPLALLLSNHDATVTLCHSKTEDLRSLTKTADIIVAAIGRPRFLDSSYLSPQKRPIVIDVGINPLPEGKICGDVDREGVIDMVTAITPVPGGIGPLTILSLAQNLLMAAEKSQLSFCSDSSF